MSRINRDKDTQDRVMCPACGGTGCETVLASADVPFLFPCCEWCKGQGRLTRETYNQFNLKQQQKKNMVGPSPSAKAVYE